MEEGTGSYFNPHAELLILDHRPLDEVEALGSQMYSKIFLDSSLLGRRILHDGNEVRFYSDTFKHAFFKSPGDYEIDIGRVARIHWILPLIAGKLTNGECWEVEQDGTEKRAYVSFGLGYIVWLKLRQDGNWTFLTAYTAPVSTLRKYIKGGKRLAVFK